MFRRNCAYALILVGALALLLSCAAAEKKPPLYKPPTIIAPSHLKVETGDQTLKLTWRTNRTESMLISGYNIYISEAPLTDSAAPRLIISSVKPFNQVPYPGDDNPETSFETFTATSLTNGVTYYVAVTIVFPDQTESAPSNVVAAICYRRGIVTLKDRSMGEQDGFSFRQNKYVAYNDVDNDLYFIVRDAGNILGSPDRNEGVLRHTGFADLGQTGTLDDQKNYPHLNFQDKTYVAEGRAYLLKLADGTLVKIRIKLVDSSMFMKQVVFEYIYFER